jgi:hypothetical protein
MNLTAYVQAPVAQSATVSAAFCFGADGIGAATTVFFGGLPPLPRVGG